MRKFRFSIAGLMGVTLVASVGFAALRNSSEAWAGLMLMLTCGMLILGVVGAICCQQPHERARWLAFAFFGGGYLLLAHAMARSTRPLPMITLAEWIASALGAKLAGRNWGSDGWNSLAPSYRILHCLWALALALLGCVLAGLVVSAADGPSAETDEATRPIVRRSKVRWTRPAVIGLSGFWFVALAVTVLRWPAPGLWAGTSFLLACGLLGLAALAAAFSRGAGREIWLGSALFGFAYLALAFGKSDLFIVAPHLPTEGMINRLLRPGGPAIQSDFPDFTTHDFVRVKNQDLMKKLDQPIPFQFPEGTSLEEVLRHVRRATADINFPGIPIYVDPVGLFNSEQTLSSKVQIDRAAIPVRDGLRLCLKQLDLDFSVRHGFVMISDGSSATIPVYEDPIQVIGHSLLALVAAGLGAVAARFVFGRRGRNQQVDMTSVTERQPS